MNAHQRKVARRKWMADLVGWNGHRLQRMPSYVAKCFDDMPVKSKYELVMELLDIGAVHSNNGDLHDRVAALGMTQAYAVARLVSHSVRAAAYSIYYRELANDVTAFLLSAGATSTPLR